MPECNKCSQHNRDPDTNACDCDLHQEEHIESNAWSSLTMNQPVGITRWQNEKNKEVLMSHCPSCISYKTECDPSQEDGDNPCKDYKPRIQECSVCGSAYDIDVGCMRCERHARIERGL